MYSASSFFCLSLNIFVGIRFATQAGEDEGTNADYQGNSHEDVNNGDGPFDLSPSRNVLGFWFLGGFFSADYMNYLIIIE